MKKRIVGGIGIILSCTMIFPVAASTIQSPILITPNQTVIALSKNGLAVLNYTITNNSSKTLNNIEIEPGFGVSDPSAFSLHQNTCSSLEPHASCAVDVYINGDNLTSSNFKVSPRVCAFNKLVCSQAEEVNRVQVTVMPGTIALAAGVNSISGHPLLVESVTNGAQWNQVISSSFNITSTFLGANCDHMNCIAIGGDFLSGIPLLAISQNEGSWSTVDLTSTLPDGGVFNAGICTSNNCVAVGSSNTGLPILVVGQNHNWVNSVPVSFTDTGVLNAANCTGNTCVSVGQDTSTNAPIIFSNQNINQSGIPWVSNALTSTAGFLNSVGCEGSVCVAAGQDTSSNNPLIFYSQNNAATWSKANLISLSLTGSLNAVSCTTLQCVAVGGDDTPLPYILISSNEANWSKVNLSAFNLTGTLFSVSCSYSLCVAAGQEIDGTPIILVSQDYGTHWNNVNLSSISTNAVLNSASCSNSFCLVVGQDAPFLGSPLIIFTTNNGNTWSSVDLSQISTSGSFNGSSVSFS